jgi:protein-histidine pros-kinase
MGDVPETTDYKLLQRKLAREMAARAEAEALLESRSRELYASNLALSDANRQLTVAREDSEEASKAKSLFIGNMSHELLTPMNSIIGLSQLLLDTPLDDKQRHFLQSISSSAQVLLSMLKDVMQISAIDSGRLALHPRWFRVDELIEEAAAQIHAAARPKGLEIILSHVDILHTKILADRERLVQALQILLSNAVKFTEQGVRPG